MFACWLVACFLACLLVCLFVMFDNMVVCGCFGVVDAAVLGDVVGGGVGSVVCNCGPVVGSEVGAVVTGSW